jgi:hypothetical protein
VPVVDLRPVDLVSHEPLRLHDTNVREQELHHQLPGPWLEQAHLDPLRGGAVRHQELKGRVVVRMNYELNVVVVVRDDHRRKGEEPFQRDHDTKLGQLLVLVDRLEEFRLRRGLGEPDGIEQRVLCRPRGIVLTRHRLGERHHPVVGHVILLVETCRLIDEDGIEREDPPPGNRRAGGAAYAIEGWAA